MAWGIVGVLALLLFNAGWLISETWQGPLYSPIGDTISDMQAATAPHVWFPIACFAIGALGSFGFVAFGLRPTLGRLRGYSLWPLAFALLALGNSFPLIPCRLSDAGCTASVQLASPGGLTDAVVAGLAFFVLAFSPWPLWRRLAPLSQWQPVKPVMLAARVVCPVAWMLLAVSTNVGGMPAVGLIERVLAASCSAWVGALAVAVIVQSQRTGRAERSATSAPP